MAALLDRAVAALDDAFLEQVKAHYVTMLAKIAGNQSPDSVLEQFRLGITEAYSARDAAAGSVRSLIGAA